MGRPASEEPTRSLTFRIPQSDHDGLEAIVDVTPRANIPELVRRGVKWVLQEMQANGSINMKEPPEM